MSCLKVLEFLAVLLAVGSIGLNGYNIMIFFDAKGKLDTENAQVVEIISSVHNNTGDLDNALVQLDTKLIKTRDGPVAEMQQMTEDTKLREVDTAWSIDHIKSGLATDCRKLFPFDGQLIVGGPKEISIDNDRVRVFCDFLPDNGGGWTVIQRQTNVGTLDFRRTFKDYVNGFGEITGNHWLGLKYIYGLLNKKEQFTLRVDLEDFDGNTAYAVYSSCSIGHANGSYILKVDGYNGTAGDSLPGTTLNVPFSTFDRDNDRSSSLNCAEDHQAGWWFDDCGQSNLNGRYITGGKVDSTGIFWYSWKNSFYSLKRVEMKVRPITILS